MNKAPNAFDKFIARILSGELPLELILGGIAILSVVASIKLVEYEYLRECFVEVAVGSAFFLAIYLFQAAKLTVRFASALLTGGLLAGLIGWQVSQTMHLLSSYMLKAASAAVVFVVIEHIIRGILIRAAQSRANWEMAVQGRRRTAMSAAQRASRIAADKTAAAGKVVAKTVGDTAAMGVIVVAGAVLKSTGNTITLEYEDENGTRHPMEGPDLPEPLFDMSDDDNTWSMAGIFGRKSDWETRQKTIPPE